MARATTYTHLSLDRFAFLIGLHPLHFNQVAIDPSALDPRAAPINNCGLPIVQWSWQAGERLGREEIANAISDAEQLLELYLGFPLAPAWYVETLNIPRPYKTELFNGWGLNSRGLWAAVKTERGYVWSAGQEAWSLLSADVNVAYTDLDGDNYKETATLALTVPNGTLAQEVSLYYPGSGTASIADPSWEIRPIAVTVTEDAYNVTTATITCRREQLLLAQYLEQLGPTAQDGMNDANFLATADVYRHYTDPSAMLEFSWEQLPFGCQDCQNNTAGCVACQHRVSEGCAEVRDHRQGFVSLHPAKWSVDTQQFDRTYWPEWRAPDRVKLWYRAGYPAPVASSIGRAAQRDNTMPTGLIAAKFERAVCYLALARLDRLLCDCNMLKSLVHHWQEDLAMQVISSGAGSSFRLSPNHLSNPFGTTRAGLYAWDLIQPERKGEAVVQ